MVTLLALPMTFLCVGRLILSLPSISAQTPNCGSYWHLLPNNLERELCDYVLLISGMIWNALTVVTHGR